jgi:hypothetical protein
VRRIARGALWLQHQRTTFNRWIVRLASLYFGYRILHHEVYEVEHVEPLIFFFGLWLIGIAPASFVEGLKKVGTTAKGALEEMTDEITTPEDKAAADKKAAELKLKPKPKPGENGA